MQHPSSLSRHALRERIVVAINRAGDAFATPERALRNSWALIALAGVLALVVVVQACRPGSPRSWEPATRNDTAEVLERRKGRRKQD